MSFFRGWKAFGAVGTATGIAGQYSEGLKGKPFNVFDIGPQAFPKILGRLHHSHNQLAQLQGHHETEAHRARLVAELQHDSRPTSFEMKERRVQRHLDAINASQKNK